MKNYFFKPHPDENHVYTTGEDTNYPLDPPVRTREECTKVVNGRPPWHGSGIKFGDVTVCFYCNTIVTKQNLEDRVKAYGGPGHWLGCKLDPNHEGDCVL